MTALAKRRLVAGSVGATAAIVSALPMLELCGVYGFCGWLVTMAFPGMLASMAIAGNVHAFSISLTMLFNFAIYSMLCLLLLKLFNAFDGR